MKNEWGWERARERYRLHVNNCTISRHLHGFLLVFHSGSWVQVREEDALIMFQWEKSTGWTTVSALLCSSYPTRLKVSGNRLTVIPLFIPDHLWPGVNTTSRRTDAVVLREIRLTVWCVRSLFVNRRWRRKNKKADCVLSSLFLLLFLSIVVGTLKTCSSVRSQVGKKNEYVMVQKPNNDLVCDLATQCKQISPRFANASAVWN